MKVLMLENLTLRLFVIWRFFYNKAILKYLKHQINLSKEDDDYEKQAIVGSTYNLLINAV